MRRPHLVTRLLPSVGTVGQNVDTLCPISTTSSLRRRARLLPMKWVQNLLSGILPCPELTLKTLALSTLTEPPLGEGEITRGLERLSSKPSLITFNLPSSFPKEAPGNRSWYQAPPGFHFTMELGPTYWPILKMEKLRLRGHSAG